MLVIAWCWERGREKEWVCVCGCVWGVCVCAEGVCVYGCVWVCVLLLFLDEKSEVGTVRMQVEVKCRFVFKLVASMLRHTPGF